MDISKLINCVPMDISELTNCVPVGPELPRQQFKDVGKLEINSPTASTSASGSPRSPAHITARHEEVRTVSVTDKSKEAAKPTTMSDAFSALRQRFYRPAFADTVEQKGRDVEGSADMIDVERGESGKNIVAHYEKDVIGQAHYHKMVDGYDEVVTESVVLHKEGDPILDHSGKPTYLPKTEGPKLSTSRSYKERFNSIDSILSGGVGKASAFLHKYADKGIDMVFGSNTQAQIGEKLGRFCKENKNLAILAVPFYAFFLELGYLLGAISRITLLALDTLAAAVTKGVSATAAFFGKFGKEAIQAVEHGFKKAMDLIKERKFWAAVCTLLLVMIPICTVLGLAGGPFVFVAIGLGVLTAFGIAIAMIIRHNHNQTMDALRRIEDRLDGHEPLTGEADTKEPRAVVSGEEKQTEDYEIDFSEQQEAMPSAPPAPAQAVASNSPSRAYTSPQTVRSADQSRDNHQRPLLVPGTYMEYQPSVTLSNGRTLPGYPVIPKV